MKKQILFQTFYAQPQGRRENTLHATFKKIFVCNFFFFMYKCLCIHLNIYIIIMCIYSTYSGGKYIWKYFLILWQGQKAYFYFITYIGIKQIKMPIKGRQITYSIMAWGCLLWYGIGLPLHPIREVLKQNMNVDILVSVMFITCWIINMPLVWTSFTKITFVKESKTVVHLEEYLPCGLFGSISWLESN